LVVMIFARFMTGSGQPSSAQRASFGRALEVSL
jgi:hypothetical protein